MKNEINLDYLFKTDNIENIADNSIKNSLIDNQTLCFQNTAKNTIDIVFTNSIKYDKYDHGQIKFGSCLTCVYDFNQIIVNKKFVSTYYKISNIVFLKDVQETRCLFLHEKSANFYLIERNLIVNKTNIDYYNGGIYKNNISETNVVSKIQKLDIKSKYINLCFDLWFVESYDYTNNKVHNNLFYSQRDFEKMLVSV